MVTYKFKLIDSKVPVVRGKNIITDSNVGGVKNTYEIRIVYRMDMQFTLWDKKIPIVKTYYSRPLGKKTFWRPYQTVWDKRKHRVPAPYWGKGPLLNMWLVLLNDYPDPSKVKVIVTDGDTTHHTMKIFNVEFLSQTLNKNLKSNQSFYQSKFERHGKK